MVDEKRFDTMKNGYNRFQVDDCLMKLHDEIAMLTHKVELYRMRSEDVEEQLKDIKQKYEFVVTGLAAKEKAAEDMSRLAMREANTIVNTAQQNADVIVKEALMTARSILLDIAGLGKEAAQLKGSMKEQLDVLEKALNAFEVPPIPDMELLNSTEEKR
nr:DivIVA domain-containing protein [Copranaerobaculum intestinale]